MAVKVPLALEQGIAPVLIVEDSPETSVFIRQALERVGLQVTIAATRERALELAMLERPDLIVLDLDSPGFKGLELCAELRKEPVTRGIPLVFLAGWETSKSIETEARRLGAADIIGKPFQTLDFVARVLRCLRQRARLAPDILDWVANR